jgi:hypothetical protein
LDYLEPVQGFGRFSFPFRLESEKESIYTKLFLESWWGIKEDVERKDKKWQKFN